ncbi:2-keto-4-pentenoate hydratase/2-oxohepta-3-ene-1,7-dioic acid hydratase in catechol pathway [Variovorax paradoxus]|uniref:2-keto-4-pentenoate hydratase/2-oxohepta-3-ene-1,7-dioic acid hydratase in catechol pathway n=1 Tax=Variovorax paradoxus TaxID=34073 RepID=A0AAW8EGB2_VARPD|nr:fumarylacetoacetate hydrolase family protein [Variovorax paradoxus]MDP9971880.1 2-keto-4-pentenoate hydratase/2-oxohepta-3-ene-1,7-dioic acid hydratase in catechol pathway [Variovorax paradoxus]
MKLLSFVHQGRETWGAVVGDSVVDLGKARPQHAGLVDYIASGEYLKAAQHVEGLPTAARLADITFLPPIPKSEKIVCAVRNYMDHHQEVLAAGMQRELSEQPPIFLRVWRSQCAHNQPIVRPHVSESLDWEGELAVIIGKGGRNIAEADAFDHVAGYSCYNDGSVREWQFHAKQIASGKNFESTGGFGPWMVTADEIAPGRELKLETRLNGEVVQSSHTGHMIFSIPKLISYASTIFTLVPGDVIATGTPAGVGWSKKPPRFMKPGDVCEVEIEGIGVLRNPIVQQD